MNALLALMARLRSPEGCPWDREQSFETIAPYTIEEAHEVADAIMRNDMAALKDELGDLLFQVVFHAQMADEAGHFAFNDVARAIVSKMERRHPHVFGDGARPDWEATKAEERAKSEDQSALAGVALGLPALMRAEKLQKRAARTGFDWPDEQGPLAKVHEEIAEVQDAHSPSHREEEIGDLLFAVVNWARHLGIDPEVALRGANAKFERRFRSIEGAPGFAAMSLDEKEAEWVKAKRG
jgi:ATP diphosphatase